VEKIPEYIFLQLNGDGGPEYSSIQATWADEQIFDNDIKYKRVEEVLPEIKSDEQRQRYIGPWD